MKPKQYAIPNRKNDQNSAPDMATLGKIVRNARKNKGWTLEEAGQRAGIGRSTLSKIENNLTRPSFEIIRRITQALEIETPQLFLQAKKKDVSGRRDTTRKGTGEIRQTPTYTHELLCTELSSKKMLPYISTINARSITEFEDLIRHPGEEFMYVLSGALDFHTEHYRPLQLKAGDSVYYDSGMGHCCVSTSKEDAVILWISLEQ